MRLYGLTGNTGTGKSTVARLLADRGIPVIDADELARRVVEPGQPALEEIARAFGSQYLDDAGRLDRRALGRRVFSDGAARDRLEGILHPRILALASQQARELEALGHRIAVLDAAALVEAGLARAFHGLIVVKAEPDRQIARIMARDGLSREDAEQRLSAQLPIEVKVKLADYVIDNAGTLEDLERSVAELVRWLERDPTITR